MKIDQIAFYCDTEEGQDKIKKHFGLQDAQWVQDEVTARSLFSDGSWEVNVADLQFNYDLGIELEILRYKKGKNWHSERGTMGGNRNLLAGYAPQGYISHVGIHLDDGEEFPVMEGCPLVQETFTESHTAPYLTIGPAAGRKYHYRIHQLTPGSYIKYIRRLHARQANG